MKTFRLVCYTLLTSLMVTGCLENEYKSKGELYQCYIDGKAIYKSNVRPVKRGGKWVELNGDVVEVDDCYCMGCLSL